MNSPMRSRPSPSLVVSMVALFIALSGTAMALPESDTVFSDDIVNEEVTSADIANANVTGSQLRNLSVTNANLAADAVRTGRVRNRTLTGADLADDGIGSGEIGDGAVGPAAVDDNSLTGADIVDDSLTGADISGLTGADVANGTLTGADFATNSITGDDIEESALGSAVPNANSAANAQAVDGVSARSFEYHAGNTGTDTVIYSQGGLTVVADCDEAPVAGAHVQLFADSSANDSYIYAANLTREENLETTAVDTDFDQAEARKVVKQAPGLNDFDFGGYGVIAFRRGPAAGTDTSSPDVVTVEYYFEGNDSCDVFGTGIGGAN